MTYFSKIVRWLFNKPSIKTKQVFGQKFNESCEHCNCPSPKEESLLRSTISDTRERKMYQGITTRNYDMPKVIIRPLNKLMPDNISTSQGDRDCLEDSGYAVNQQDDNEMNTQFYSGNTSTSLLSESEDPLLLLSTSSENQATSSLDCIMEKINDVWQRSRFVDYSLSGDDVATMQDGMTSAREELLPFVVEGLTGRVDEKINYLKQARDRSRKRINPFTYTDMSPLDTGDIDKNLKLSPPKQKKTRRKTIEHIDFNTDSEYTLFTMSTRNNVNWEDLIADNIG